jgi:hypothetical protein
MRDGRDSDGTAGLEQPVVAIPVGGWFDAEPERLRNLQCGGSSGGACEVQEVHDVRARCDLFLQCARAGLTHRLEPVDRHHREHLDELAIAVGVLGQPLVS